MKLLPEILKNYQINNGDLDRALIFGDPETYYLIVKSLIREKFFQDLLFNENLNAYDLLTETLIAFRRQLKSGKATIQFQKQLILVNNKQEISEYLKRIFTLMAEEKADTEFQNKVDENATFIEVYHLKDKVMNTLGTIGLQLKVDPEEVFQESILRLWDKISHNEIRIIKNKLDQPVNDWVVYNRFDYSNSRLSTYLVAIAKNLVYNNYRFQKLRNSESIEIIENRSAEVETNPDSDPILLCYKYFRVFYEDRKLRSIISILHYDCGLEEKEVCHLLKINNARIHNSRLKSDFNDWYCHFLKNYAKYFLELNHYAREIESKEHKLNQKLMAITQFISRKSDVDLNIFKEEFRSQEEFRGMGIVFRNVLYLVSLGKASNISGLPEEPLLREKHASLKSSLFNLEKVEVILYLLFYASMEPEYGIQQLLIALKEEMTGIENDLNFRFLLKPSDLKNDMYSVNQRLFGLLDKENLFYK